MKIASASASKGRIQELLDRVIPSVLEEIGGKSADLGALFATNHFEDELQRAVAQVRDKTAVRTLIGCTGEGVIGPAHEHENEPALVLWLAHLPGAKLKPFALTQADIEAAHTQANWPQRLGVTDLTEPSFLILGDPYSTDVNAVLGGINQQWPGRPVLGGMASGAEAPGQSALILNDAIEREGIVGVALAGPITVTTVVSQGCRPVGRPFVITKAERNIILQLGGRKPLDVLNELFAESSTSEQRLMKQGIFIGRVINEQQAEFHRGDFLIRNLMGADPESGAIAVAELVRAGTTVQFHVRDAASADEDLRTLLAPQSSSPPAGALLFSCNGRGTRMYKDRDHDLGILQKALAAPPVAGFFCAGELGPVGGKNFIHGHTASIALFRPR